MAAKRGKEVLAPLEYKGTTDYALVEWWLVNMLFPLLAIGSIIILDNASFHKKTELKELAEEYGFTIIFLPPYSPDFNPLEKFWAWMKSHLKKIIRNYDTFCDALLECFRLE
jgi:putative transposase